MCQHYIRKRSKSGFGLRSMYVKCGVCADCRRERQLAEQFRLNAEFLTLKRKGFHVAMATLTYDDHYLPHLPKALFLNSEEYTPIPCFSRKDVKAWIDRVRHYCKYHYHCTGDRRLRYFIGCEYGEHTHRPHLHAVLAFPSDIPYETMHALCSETWTKGILFPRNPQGDYNPRQNKQMFPFEVVGDAAKALAYVSKYVCKDITFINDVETRVHLNKKLRIYKDCVPFYMQSQSLGYAAIRDLTDAEKVSIYKDGMDFQGDGNHFSCPVYIKNKLLYDNVYQYTKDGRRVVSRAASAFFEKYKKAIFVKKASFYNKLFNSSFTADYFIQRGLDTEVASRYARALQTYRLHIQERWNHPLETTFGDLYLCYGHVDIKSCYPTSNLDERVEQYMLRYRLDEDVCEDAEHIDGVLWHCLQKYFCLVQGIEQFTSMVNLDQRTALERRNKRILDFFNGMLDV